jgi:FkbM family methyltransferase
MMGNPIRKYLYYLSSIFRLLVGIREWPEVVRVFLGAAQTGTRHISFKKTGAVFKVRGAMDIWSVKETFLDRFYEIYGSRVGDGWKIIDIGAGIGEFTVFAALGHPRNHIFAFEPFPESYNLLQENLRLNGAGNAQVFPEAIGSETGSLALDLSGGEPLQLQSHQLEAQHIIKNTLVVPCLSLADAFDRLKLEYCDLLKLDCEGAEYQILMEAPQTVLRRIHRIIMEYHDLEDGHTHTDLQAFLISQGFRVSTHPNFVHADLGYLYAELFSIN